MTRDFSRPPRWTEARRGDWYIAVRSAKYGGYCLVVFSPEERVIEAIRPFLPRQLAFEVFGPNFNRKPNLG